MCPPVLNTMSLHHSSPFSLCSFSYPSPSLLPSLSIIHFPLFRRLSSLSFHCSFPLALLSLPTLSTSLLTFSTSLSFFQHPSSPQPSTSSFFKFKVESRSRYVKVLTSQLPLARPLTLSVSLLFLSAFLPSDTSEHRISHNTHTI